MSHDHVQGLHRLEGHAGQPPGQGLVQVLQADAGDALDGDFEAAVFAFAWDGHLKLYLCGGRGGRVGCTTAVREEIKKSRKRRPRSQLLYISSRCN